MHTTIADALVRLKCIQISDMYFPVCTYLYLTLCTMSIVRDAMCGNYEYNILYYESALTPRPVETLESPEHGAQFFLHPNILIK